jgi:hypothetical protein
MRARLMAALAFLPVMLAITSLLASIAAAADPCPSQGGGGC